MDTVTPASSEETMNQYPTKTMNIDVAKLEDDLNLPYQNQVVVPFCLI